MPPEFACPAGAFTRLICWKEERLGSRHRPSSTRCIREEPFEGVPLWAGSRSNFPFARAGDTTREFDAARHNAPYGRGDPSQNVA
jgi:hypothetical protein